MRFWFGISTPPTRAHSMRRGCLLTICSNVEQQILICEQADTIRGQVSPKVRDVDTQVRAVCLQNVYGLIVNPSRLSVRLLSSKYEF